MPWLVTLTATLAIAGCGGVDESATTTSPTTPMSTPAGPTTTSTSSGTSTTTRDQGPPLTESCALRDREVRIGIRYPRGWRVNSGQTVPECTAFDPDPIQLGAATELPRELAVVVRIEPVGFDRASAADGVRVEAERRMTVDGRRAVRQEVVTTGRGLGPAGQRSVRYVVDGGTDRSILASTWNVEGNNFAASTEVLDAMATSFDIEPRN